MQINGFGVSNYSFTPKDKNQDEKCSLGSNTCINHEHVENPLMQQPYSKQSISGICCSNIHLNLPVKKQDYQNLLQKNIDFWQISPDAVDDTTALILSGHIRNISEIKDASTLAKIMLDEANQTEVSYLRRNMLQRAVKLLPNGDYNNDEYSEKLREEILKSSLELTKNPVDNDTLAVCYKLEDSEKNNNPAYKEWENSGFVNYYLYTKMKSVSADDEIEMMNDPTINESRKKQFVYEKMFVAANKEENKQEKIYLTKMALINMKMSKIGLSNSDKLMKFIAAEKIPELKESANEDINTMFKSYFPELNAKNISQNTKIILLKKATSFKQGSGWVEPKHYAVSDKIDDILQISMNYDTGKSITTEEKQELKNIAYVVAKNNGQGYVDALNLHYDDGKRFDIYRRKGDNTLYLAVKNDDEFYNEEDNKIALEYIECGDSSLTGGAYAINSALRRSDEKELNNSIMKKEIEGLDRLTTDKNTALDNDYVVIRAIGSGEHLKDYTKEGNIVFDKGYVSTTPRVGTYSNMFGGRPGESYVMRIKLPKGTRGANFKRCQPYLYGGNEEFLLPRNSQFKIKKVNEDTKVIEAEYILPDYDGNDIAKNNSLVNVKAHYNADEIKQKQEELTELFKIKDASEGYWPRVEDVRLSTFVLAFENKIIPDGGNTLFKKDEILSILEKTKNISEQEIENDAKNIKHSACATQLYFGESIRKEFLENLYQSVANDPSIDYVDVKCHLDNVRRNLEKKHSDEFLEERAKTKLEYLNDDEINAKNVELTKDDIDLLKSHIEHHDVSADNYDLKQLSNMIISEYVGGNYSMKHLPPHIITACLQTQKRYNSEEKDFNPSKKEPVYRWLCINDVPGFINNFPEVGQEYSYPDMQSCSKYKGYAENEFRDDSPDMLVKLVFHPIGETSQAYDIGNRKYGGNEVIYPPNAKFKVLAKEFVESTKRDEKYGTASPTFYRYVIHLQEVAPEK